MNHVALIRGSLLLVLTLGLAYPAQAGDSTEVTIVDAISGPGVVAISAGAIILPLLTEQGGNQALRTADAISTSAIISIGIKHLIDNPRPDGSGFDSFPSSHATVAFAAATMAADRHPEQAPYWYGAASLIAYSRVRLNRHRPREVIAGAALGYGIAKLEQQLPRGLLLAPLITPECECYGVKVTWEF